VPNCAVTLIDARKTSYSIAYDAAGTTDVTSGWKDVFAVPHPDVCGAITTCKIFQGDCVTALTSDQ
jgi:hypothetical protein